MSRMLSNSEFYYLSVVSFIVFPAFTISSKTKIERESLKKINCSSTVLCAGDALTDW